MPSISVPESTSAPTPKEKSWLDESDSDSESEEDEKVKPKPMKPLKLYEPVSFVSTAPLLKPKVNVEPQTPQRKKLWLDNSESEEESLPRNHGLPIETKYQNKESWRPSLSPLRLAIGK
jgi:hypothetical protein